MTTLRFELIGDPAGLQPVYEAAGSQKDNLCGVYWADIAIQSMTDRRFIDEEDAALVAGSVVPEGGTDPVASFPWGGDGPRGRVEGSGPYRLAVPTSSDEAELGTSADGVALAIETLSASDLAVLPLRHERWDAATVVAMLDALAALGGEPLIAIANISTGPLATSLHSRADLLAHLLTGRPLPSRPGDWDVGHFVTLAGVIRGPAADLVIVRDTYQLLGARGYHLQTPAGVAAALHRDGSGAGGVLVAARPALAEAARRALDGLGLVEGLWDNGSPGPTKPATRSASVS